MMKKQTRWIDHVNSLTIESLVRAAASLAETLKKSDEMQAVLVANIADLYQNNPPDKLEQIIITRAITYLSALVILAETQIANRRTVQ